MEDLDGGYDEDGNVLDVHNIPQSRAYGPHGYDPVTRERMAVELAQGRTPAEVFVQEDRTEVPS
jgi:hypothetical protein